LARAGLRCSCLTAGDKERIMEITGLVNEVEERIGTLLKEFDALHAKASVLISSCRKLQLENEQYKKKLSVVAGIVTKGGSAESVVAAEEADSEAA